MKFVFCKTMSLDIPLLIKNKFEIKLKRFFEKMEDIRDPFEHEVVEYLEVGDLLRLCKTSRQWRDFCKRKETWKYLLERDFEVVVKGDERYHYEANYRISKWRNLVQKVIIKRYNYEDFESKSAEFYQEGFLAMMDLAAWDLVDPYNFPRLNVSVLTPNIKDVGYIFLRRVVSLYYTQPYSLWDGKEYPIYKILNEMYNSGRIFVRGWPDIIISRGITFVNKMMTDQKFGVNFMGNGCDFINFTFEDMMDELDICREPIDSGTTFEKILQSFRDHPTDDILLQYCDLGIPPITL